MKEDRKPQPTALLVDRHQLRRIGKDALCGGMQLQDARSPRSVSAQLGRGLGVVRMNRGCPQQAVARAVLGDGSHPSLGEIVPERQAESDGQDHRLLDA